LENNRFGVKAVILARVSSKEQEEGHSIDAQLQRLRAFSKSNRQFA